MEPKLKEFIGKLADLIEEYDAIFYPNSVYNGCTCIDVTVCDNSKEYTFEIKECFLDDKKLRKSIEEQIMYTTNYFLVYIIQK